MSQQLLKICIIGGGASGLAVAKVIKDSDQFKSGIWSIDVFEEREDIGGTWLPDPNVDTDVPPATPMYESIITNLPHPIMCYPSFWFPPSTPLFPKADVVQDYIRAYAKEFDLLPRIRLNTSVESAVWSGTNWSVTIRTTSPSAGVSRSDAREHSYDKLIIATGHYRYPFYPSIPGLTSWRSAGRVTHSAWYRRPVHVGDKVLVVGGGYSGIDIAEEMSTVCKTLIHAAPHSVAESHANIIVNASRLVKLSDLTENANAGGSEIQKRRIAYFEDGSTESDIDHIFLATGYVISYPFLKPPQLIVTPPDAPIHPLTPSDPLPDHLHNSEEHLFPLAKFLFPLSRDFPPESAAFVGLPIKVAPFPLFEAQARAIVRVFADPGALDVRAEIEAVHERLTAIRSNPDNIANLPSPPESSSSSSSISTDSLIAHSWHIFKGREQFNYRDSLHAFSGFTTEEWKVPEWVKVAYENMVGVRKLWKELVEKGEDGKWWKGVGEKGGEEGKEEWVRVMEELIGIVKSRKEAQGNGLDGEKARVEPEKVV